MVRKYNKGNSGINMIGHLSYLQNLLICQGKDIKCRACAVATLPCTRLRRQNNEADFYGNAVMSG